MPVSQSNAQSNKTEPDHVPTCALCESTINIKDPGVIHVDAADERTDVEFHLSCLRKAQPLYVIRLLGLYKVKVFDRQQHRYVPLIESPLSQKTAL